MGLAQWRSCRPSWMKRLLLLLPLLFIAGCGKYGSYVEADSACNSWRFQKGSVDIANSVHSKAKTIPIRVCVNEVVTSQILGYEYPEAEASTTYIFKSGAGLVNENGNVLPKLGVIAKRFKY